MATANGSAEIVDMADARARLAADAGEFEHVGARLAAIRESRGVSLSEAAGRTHIRENHLAAIEAVDGAALPARPYALGFVRTYAEFLELDPRPVVEQFKFDAGYEAPQPVEAEKFRAAEDAADAEGRDMSLTVFIAIIAFIIWCAWQITLTAKVTPLGEEAAGAAPVIETPAPEPAPGVVVDPRVAERVEPVYPFSCAPAARASETVTVAFTVTATGRVAGERVTGSTNDCFDAAALNALRRWRFEPKTVDGAAKPAYDRVETFRFERP
ncbi:TonB family protein [Hyphococcus luteus]|uniref:TonB family protein n=1 Tax=Hyphococcus luteus TaxID=2058213 RepID=UPI0013FE2786|nr:TonB family protein [Marinicaulis flavus]